MSTRDQRPFWSHAAGVKSFGHPLDWELLEPHLPADPRWLDYGCGYGRLVAELRERGHERVVGLDSAPGMVVRARREHPEATFVLDGEQESDGALGTFDVVLVVSVWTCVPEDVQLEALMARVRSFVKPGGLLYLSDYLLQDDERNREHYARNEDGPWGVFDARGGRALAPLRASAGTGAPRRLRGARLPALRGAHHERQPARAFRVLAQREGGGGASG